MVSISAQANTQKYSCDDRKHSEVLLDTKDGKTSLSIQDVEVELNENGVAPISRKTSVIVSNKAPGIQIDFIDEMGDRFKTWHCDPK